MRLGHCAQVDSVPRAVVSTRRRSIRSTRDSKSASRRVGESASPHSTHPRQGVDVPAAHALSIRQEQHGPESRPPWYVSLRGPPPQHPLLTIARLSSVTTEFPRPRARRAGPSTCDRLYRHWRVSPSVCGLTCVVSTHLLTRLPSQLGDDAGFRALARRVSVQVQKISANTAAISKLVELLGTPRDNPTLRTRLSVLRGG